MKRLLILAFLLSTGCTHLTKAKMSDRRFLIGPLPIEVATSDIEFDLSREVQLSTSDQVKDKIRVTAILQTGPLIESQELQAVKMGKQTEAEARKNVKSALRQLVTTKTCFVVEFQAYDNPERAKFEFWNARVVQNGTKYPVNFKSLRKLAYDPQNSFKGLPEGLTSHSNYSLACTSKPVELSSEIHLDLSPEWDPKKPWYRLSWQ
ncbi:MAG: hypothetical protein KDD25_07775 [Bdellovibrionales bacterium]|nr:hypothetical protein [Bdellovibrionales bacterium]